MPAPLIPLALLAAPKIINQQTDKKRLQRDTDRVNNRLDRLGAQEKDLLGKRQYGVGDSYNQFLAASKQDKAADLLRQQASQQEAAGIGALKAGGAKALLGGLGSVQGAAANKMASIEADSQNRQQQALKDYAGVEQSRMDANVGLAAQDLSRTRSLQDLSRADRELLRGEKRRQKDARTDQYMNMASQFLTGKSGAKVPEYADGGSKVGNFLFGDPGDTADKKFFEKDRTVAAAGAFSQGVKEAGEMSRYTGLSGLHAQAKQTEQTAEEQEEAIQKPEEKSPAKEKTAFERIMGRSIGQNFNFEGGLNATQKRLLENTATDEKRNGGVQKTPGKFSHATNPIDIMREGSKIGEMTGGEYIFNPNQARTLEALASKGGSPLHKYVKGLLKEFDKR